MPETLHILIPLILTTNLGQKYCFSLHFNMWRNQGTEVNWLSKITQVVNGGGKIGPQTDWSRSSCSLTLDYAVFSEFGQWEWETGRTVLSSPHSSLFRAPLYFGLILEAGPQPTGNVSVTTIPAYLCLVFFFLTYLPLLTQYPTSPA